ncbi:MAG: metal dependent phosphohydrolase with sensor [Rubritepida sp.]|nr:metal dependent phosphohydrolase with sensor [Rubritepida sp.]
MPRRPLPDRPLPDPAPVALGVIAADRFGERIALALETRAQALLDRLHNHHPDSAAHSIRVAQLTMAMWSTARDLLGPAETALIGSLLHDAGKLYVPRSILGAERLLTPAERIIMCGHTGLGAELLAAQGFPDPVIAIARDHHERWSGGGYPSGAPAHGRLPIVRAVAVADAFIAMIETGRAYRAPMNHLQALREVEACSGTHFDPVAAAILRDSMALWRQRLLEREAPGWERDATVFPPLFARYRGSCGVRPQPAF